MKWLRNWRRKSILRNARLDQAAWEKTLALPIFTGLTLAERAQLADWVTLFLHDKTIFGAAGLIIDGESYPFVDD